MIMIAIPAQTCLVQAQRHQHANLRQRGVTTQNQDRIQPPNDMPTKDFLRTPVLMIKLNGRASCSAFQINDSSVYT